MSQKVSINYLITQFSVTPHVLNGSASLNPPPPFIIPSSYLSLLSLLPCMEKLLIPSVPFRLLLTPIPPLPFVKSGLFLPIPPQSHSAWTWWLCGTFFLSLTKTVEVTGPNLDWRRALTSSGVLALYLLFFDNSTSMCLFLCVFWKGRFWLKCFVVTEQDGSPITASLHWQVG